MLKQLQLKNFRCFDSVSMELGPCFTFVIGANGEGKTSILEGACVLLRLQSQRISTLEPLIRVGAKLFEVRGSFDGHQLEFQYGGLRRKLRFDEVEQQNAAEYLRIARIVSFANADIDIIRGGSDARRRYIDFVGTQIDSGYRPILRAYERALRARNALLKCAPARPRELAAYDGPLIEHGTRLSALRAAIVKRLSPYVAAAYADVSTRSEAVDVYFAPGNVADFADDLLHTREEENRLRQTIVGPHRDEVELFVDGMSAQVFASEGQQRTFALALKIAQARVFSEQGAPPLLLLDDTFGELDLARRHALLNALPVTSQKLVTATHWQWDEDFNQSLIFELRDRKLTRREM